MSEKVNKHQKILHRHYSKLLLQGFFELIWTEWQVSLLIST